MSWSLGVDFGTSNTAAAYRVDGGPAQPVRLSDQAEQMPSAVLALDSGILVGGAAIRSARLDPQRFEPSPKRRLGEQDILLGSQEWPVSQLIAQVLSHVKQKAMWVAGGQPPDQLVLTYPQQWAQGRKDLLVDAAVKAGFEPSTIRMVTEPIAAATWYATTQPVPVGTCVAVFDFGGGTCDVAILRAEPGPPGTFAVLAANGVDPLGGEVLDQRLLDWTLEELSRSGNKAMVDSLARPENLGALLTLKEQVRHAKHELAEYDSARIPVAVGQIQTIVTITATEFDQVVGHDIDAAIDLTRRSLVESGVLPTDLYALYLTGGSSHLRLVHRKVTELLGRPPATLNDPKLVVAQGALLVPSSVLEVPGQLPTRAIPLPVPPPWSPGPQQRGSFGPSSGATPMPTGPATGSIGAPATGGIPPQTGGLPRQSAGTGSIPIGSAAPTEQFRPQFPPSGPVPAAGPPTGRQLPPTGQSQPVPLPPHPSQQATQQLPPPAAPSTSLPPPQPQPPPPMPPPPRQAAVYQGPPQQSPRVPSPPPSGPPGYPPVGPMTSRRTPKWLIPAIAAGLVAILATVLIITLGGKDNSSVADPGASASSSTSTSTSTSTEPEKLCPNGDRIPASQTCPSVDTTTEGTNPAADVTCWDNSTAATGACPALTGQSALEWMFPVPATWNRKCEDYTGKKYDHELETYYCVVTELPNVRIYLSRWTSVTDASAKFTELFKVSPTDFSLTDNATGEPTTAGKEWVNAELTSTTSGQPLGIYADLFNDLPYSIYIEYDDPAGAGKTTAQSWYDGQLYKDPATILEAGTVP